MVRPIRQIKDLLSDIRYAWQERKNHYIDNEALKVLYLESRNSYHEKMRNALEYHKNNDLTKAFDELFKAIEYSDISDLWERKATLAKNINDNKDNVPLTLLGMVASYATSLVTTGTLISTSYDKEFNTIYDPVFWGLFAASTFFAVVGWVNQKRLRRIVKEHRDYTREFQEVTTLLDKNHSQIR
jgi:hypothetical protein